MSLKEGAAELAYQQSFQVHGFQRLSTALAGPARTYLSFIGRSPARRNRDRLPWGYRVPRAIELIYQARYIGETRHGDAMRPEAVPRIEIYHEEAGSGRALV